MTARSTTITLALSGALALVLSGCAGTPAAGGSTTVVVAAPTMTTTGTPSAAAPSSPSTTAPAPAAVTPTAGTSSVAPATIAPTPTPTSVSASPAIPSATPSSDATTTTADAAATTPTPGAAGWGHPRVQGEAGGGLTVGGHDLGRGTRADTKQLLALMGAADSVQHTTCGRTEPDATPYTAYRWGDLTVYVPEKTPSGEYGDAFPVGSIGGWRINPTADGAPGTPDALTGPDGTTVGTPLSTLQQRFTTKDWDNAYADTVQGVTRFTISSGDTVSAVFTLDGAKKVSSMEAGVGC